MSDYLSGGLGAFSGVRVITSDVLPFPPSPGAVGKRIVRHGLADVLAWLGEDVGPRPDEQTHAFIIGGNMHASAALVGRLRELS